MNRLLFVAAAISASLCSASVFAQNRSDPGFVPTGTGPAPLGGGSCATPVTIGSLPFSQAGNSCGGTNNITNYGGICGTDLPFPYPGPEDVWQMTVGAGNSVAISAALAGSAGDLALFVVSTCGNGTPCVSHSQDAIGPGIGPEDIAAQSYAPGTYFIYVDSYYAVGNGASCGTYTLNVTGTLPVSLESYRID